MSINQNRFFRSARQRAANILKNKERLHNLMKVSGDKLKEINFAKIGDSKLADRLKVIMRMVRAYRSGEYRGIELKSMLLLIAALVYFVTPIDLMPDFIPLTGFVDDFTVVVWVYTQLQEEIDKFILWEEQSTTDS